MMRSSDKPKIYRLALAALLSLSGALDVCADLRLDYEATVTAQASCSSLAPYMLGSWNEGRYAEGNGFWQEASLEKKLDTSKRFSWSIGAGYMAGVGSATDYSRWLDEAESWGEHKARRNAFRITKLYAGVKYRAAYLTAGMKSVGSRIVDDALSSGDLTRGINASPIPGVAAGFLDFVDIPLTKGWLQIDGEIMYGRMTDSGFKRNEFNYFYGKLSQNLWYNYKRCYFRTNPHKNFYVTIGMQAAGLFGGTTYIYRSGHLDDVLDRGFNFKDVCQLFFPMEGGEGYYTGSHLGSWDFKADYRLPDGSRVSAYFEWPWEDGSGVGRMNGWDGLWGLQYVPPRNPVVSKAVVEYLDFTNQSGPIHFDPDDHLNTPITGHVSGADNYYNNDYYGAYSNYGMSIGTPFLKAPIYNRNGALDFLHNRARGFHVAVEGQPCDRVSYRVKAGYQTAGGYGWIPNYRKSHCTSAMVEAEMRPLKRIPQFNVGLTMAFDSGTLRGDNFGARVRLTYQGNFDLKKAGK